MISNSLGLSIGWRRTGSSVPQVITATSLPTLGPLTDAQTPADAYTPGTYTSTAGTIVSAVETYLVNGASVAASYDLAAGDVVRVSVLVTDSAGNTRPFSTATVTVTAVPVAPSIVTPASVAEVDNGDTVTYTYTPPVVSGVPDPTVTSVLTLDGAPVALSGDSYTATKTASTQALVMTYTASNGVAPDVTSVVSSTVPAETVVVQPPVATVAPSISGTAQVGETLTGDEGTWTGSPTLAAQWLRDGVAISGATGATYTLVAADEGALISLRVTATNAGGSTVATSAAVGPVAASTSPPVTETPAAYDDDFSSYANGTQLTSLAGWTREGAAATVPSITDGQLVGTQSVTPAEIGTSRIFREMSDANHWIEQTVGTGNGGNTRGFMAGIVDQSNFVSVRWGGAASLIKEVVGGVVSTVAAFGHGQATSRLRSARPVAVNADDRLMLQVAGGKAYFFKDGVRLGSADGYAVTPNGTKLGYVNAGNPWFQTTRLRAGPLAAKVTIGDSWSVPDMVPGDFCRAFPRIAGLGGYAKGARDITVPVTVKHGAVTGFVYWLTDPTNGKRLRLSGTDVLGAAISATETSANNYDLVLRIPCGLTEYEDGTTRDGSLPYVLSVAPENDTRGFDTHPEYFVVAYSVGVIGQSNVGNFVGNSLSSVWGVPDHPGSYTYRNSVYPEVVPDRPAPGTGWFLSSDVDGQDIQSAAYTQMLSSLLDMPIMVTSFAVPAAGSGFMDPLGGEGTSGPYLLNTLKESGSAFDEWIILQGENAAGASVVSEADRWTSDWLNVLTNYATLNKNVGTTPVQIIYTGIGTEIIQEAGNLVRKRQSEAPGVFTAAGFPTIIGGHAVGVKLKDNVHYEGSPSGAIRVVQRAALSTAKRLGARTYDGRGPLADRASVSRSGAVITLPYLLNGATELSAKAGDGTDIDANAAALTGWVVADSFNATTGAYSGVKTIASVVLSGTTVTITLASDPGGPVVIGNYIGNQPNLSSWVTGSYTDPTYGAILIASEPIVDPIAVA